MEGLTKLENAVLEMLVDGKAETFQILRGQYLAARVVKRHMTGVGFWTYFSIPDEVASLPGNPSFRFGDVDGNIDGLQNGAGFLLQVKDGYIYMLEGYSFDEPWPEDTNTFQLYYEGGLQRDEGEVIKSFSPG
ncbi:hypothetical protein CU048_07240 [Beijerinckiaceae bacterium]|nr:hypothetical protein CU048_07240 [Beijerinckiaceae bacterium]